MLVLYFCLFMEKITGYKRNALRYDNHFNFLSFLFFFCSSALYSVSLFFSESVISLSLSFSLRSSLHICTALGSRLRRDSGADLWQVRTWTCGSRWVTQKWNTNAVTGGARLSDRCGNGCHPGLGWRSWYKQQENQEQIYWEKARVGGRENVSGRNWGERLGVKGEGSGTKGALFGSTVGSEDVMLCWQGILHIVKQGTRDPVQ